MKRVCPTVLWVVPVFACISCTSSPLTSEVVGLPKTAVVNQELSFKLRVHNESDQPQIIPDRSEVLFTTSLTFISGATAGEFVSKIIHSGKILSGDYASNSNVISISPPQSDYIEAGGYREYNFRWKVARSDLGTGAFRIDVPYPLPEIALQPMTITLEETEQGAAGNPLPAE